MDGLYKIGAVSKITGINIHYRYHVEAVVATVQKKDFLCLALSSIANIDNSQDAPYGV